MKKAKFFIFTLTFGLCVAGIWYQFNERDTKLEIVKRSLSDQALSLFDDDLRALTAAQVAAQVEAVTVKRTALAEQKAKIDARIDMIPFKTQMERIGIIAYLSTGCLAVLIVSCGGCLVLVRRGTVFLARVNGSEYPVPYRALKSLLPALMNEAQAKLQAAFATNENAVQERKREDLGDLTHLLSAIGGRRGFGTQAIDVTPAPAVPALTPVPIPSFAELYAQGQFAPGRPILMGYAEGNIPQYRAPSDIKSMAIAGWQGSGKTLSCGYLVTSLLLLYPDAVAYVIDPHKGHVEGLGHILAPLQASGRCQIMNEFDTPEVIDKLDGILDRRLSGASPSEPLLILAIDELSRLSKLACFDVLVSFLERCTEETRKANILFFGCSPKWNARNFKGRADIRSSMPSQLVHKMKPSQADLLLEGDTERKKILKHVTMPGTALLSTSHDADPSLIRVPLILPQDIQRVGATLSQQRNVASVAEYPLQHMATADATEEDGIPLRALPLSPLLQKVVEFMQKNEMSLSKFCEAAGMPTLKGSLSKMLNGQRELSNEMAQKLLIFFENNGWHNPP